MRTKFWLGVTTAAMLSVGGGALAQEADPSGDATTAASVAPDAPVEGAFDVEGDVDWYRMRVEAGLRYVLTLDSASTDEAVLVDPVLSVYGADGELLGVNDDSNGTFNSLLQFVPTVSGDVFVEAREFAGRVGPYRLAVASSPMPADDFGNDPSTRGRATVGRDVTGTIEYAGDVDWFRFNARSGRRYTMTLTGAGEGGLNDPFLQVLGADGETLAVNDDAGDGTLNSLLQFTPQASGVVYIEARAFADAYEGGYVLRIEEERMPRDAIAAATNTRGRIAVGGSVTGTLDYEGDHDWHRIRLEGGESYRFTLRSGDGEGALGDPFLRVYGPDGSELASDDDSGGRLNSSIEFIAPTTGDYYLDAGAFAEGYTGGYILAAAPGDIPADASTDVSLSPDGDYRQGVLSPAGDRDWYRLDLAEGQSLRISLTGLASTVGALEDPYLVIYSAAGEALALDDDSGEGLNSWLEFQAPAAGPYYLEVRGFNEDASGGYLIEIAAGEIGATIDTADFIAPGGEGRISTINSADDVDWFAVDLVETRAYRFSVDGVDPDALADPVLTLYNEEGEAVAMDDDGGPGLNAYLAFASPKGGRHYIGVSGYEGATGRYLLRVRDTEIPGNFSTDEYLDSNGDDRISAIDMPDETDFYIVMLEGGVAYTIEARPFGSNPMSNPALSLFDVNTQEVGSDDDSGPGRAARLRYTPEQSGPFAVQVRGVSGANGGYQVSIARE
jgi:hypothetical protein